jgi:hypothetical protein
MVKFARNFGIIAVATAGAIWLSTVKSIVAFVFAPALIAIGSQIATGTKVAKLIYLAISFLVLTIWLYIKEAYSPIEPPGLLALLGIWSIISAITFAAITGIEYAFTRKHSA